MKQNQSYQTEKSKQPIQHNTNSHNEILFDPFNIPSDMDYLHASSSQEFTGLIPAGTGKEEELEAYSEIFPFYEKIPHIFM